ncbi:MAG TPA: LysR family transcriptional regulator [Xanthobacteraceae bacterium]
MGFDARVLTGIGVLTAVTEAGSFARAAEALDMTPSGVSRAVARLEARLGVRLFARSPRSVALTEEGRRFHAQVLPLLTSIEEAATEAADASTAVSGRLRINVDPWFSRTLLAPCLARFLKRHPLLSVEITVSNHREEMMTGVDVAVRFGPTDPSSLIARKLLETRVLTCAAPAYLKKQGEPLTPQDLVHHEAVLFRDPQTGRPFPWEFHRKGKVLEIPVRGRMSTDDPSTAIAACVSGCGLFQSLELGLGPWLQSGKLVQILGDWCEERYPLYAYYASRHLPPAKIRAFLDFVLEIVMENRPVSVQGAAPASRSKRS